MRLAKPVLYPVMEQQLAERQREERQRQLRAQSRTAQWAAEGALIAHMLRDVPFWCGDDTLHTDDPAGYWGYGCCTQHVFGLPRHRITGLPCVPAPHQLRFAGDVIGKRLSDPQAPAFHHLCKGRQMGFTEIAVRILAHLAFSAYAGRNVGIMAATTGKLAVKDLRRLYALFANIPQVVAAPLKGNGFYLVNGTHFEAFPASEEAVTGDTQYGAIMLDESAKWRLVDDRPVFNSVEPIIRSSAADLLLISTPKGPVKMFYKIHKNPRAYVKHRYPIWEAEGSMYTRAQIDEMLAESQADPKQEYECEFTLGEGSIFGLVEEGERTDEVPEWDSDEARAAAKREDDSYVSSRPLPRDGEWPQQ